MVETIDISAQPEKKGRAGLLLGIIISVGIIGAFVFALDWDKFGRELKKVSLLYLALSAVWFFGTFWLRAIRWKLLLPSTTEVHTRTLFDSFSVGLLGTFILPFRAGELIRAWTLRRWQRVPFGTGLASIVTERVFDILAVLFLLWLALLRIDNPPPQVTSAAIVLGAIAAGVLAGMVLCYFLADWMLALGERLLGLLLRDKHPELKELLLGLGEDLINGFRAISSFGELVAVLLLSLLTWLAFAFTAQIGLWAFGEFPSFWVGITLNSVVALAVAIPSLPGFLGTFQVGCWLGLTVIFGFTKEFSVAYAVIMHAMQAVVVVLVGTYCLHRNGLGLADLRKGRDQSEEAAHAVHHHSA